VSGFGDHYHTRITHTLEVAQVSRDIARALSLNEDLAEAIALAHDLGHTPFGHAGEAELDACLQPLGFHFEHNEQSHRIVTCLEEHRSGVPGLNLHGDILEGLLKHASPHDHPPALSRKSPSLEAQIVNLSDEIAYTAHDVDDGLRAGLFTHDMLQSLALVQRAWAQAQKRGTELRGSIVDLLVRDLVQEVQVRLQKQSITTLRQVYTCAQPLVDFSPLCRTEIDALRQFLWDHFYMSSAVQKQTTRGRRIIRTLFHRFLTSPPPKVRALMQRLRVSLPEAVRDYIAGMTDAFAMRQAREAGDEG
jgi:dGTPase